MADESCSEEDLRDSILRGAEEGDEKYVRSLLERGIDPDLNNENGDAALLLAVKKRNFDVAKLLVNFGAKVNKRNTRGEATLIEAINSADYSIIELLLQNGANADTVSANAGTALCFAVRRCDRKATKMLLKHGADANKVDDRGCTALYIATTNFQKEIVKDLIAGGADIDGVSHLGRTALLAAVETGTLKIIQFLLECKPDVNLRDSYGNTALSLAIKSGRTNLVQTLLRNGADANAREDLEDPLLIQAVKNGKQRMADLLLQYGANANAPDSRGNTALFHAVFSSNYSLVKILLKGGLSPTLRNAEGDTPLFYASTDTIVDALVEAGADINAKNNLGRTPYFFICRNGTAYDTIVPLSIALLKHGAQLDVVDNFGISAAFFTSSNCSKNPDSDSPILRKLWESPEYEKLEIRGFLRNLRNFQLARALSNETCVSFVSDMLEIVREKFPQVDPAFMTFTGGSPESEETTLDSCRRLLAAGASAKDRDESGCTPLLHAIEWVSHEDTPQMVFELYQLLISYGADVNSRNKYCDNVLLHMVRNSRPLSLELVYLFVNSGADVTSRTSQGESLLHLLLQRCYHCQGESLQNEMELIEYFSADGFFNLVRSRDNRGDSVLHVWARGPDAHSLGPNADDIIQIGRQLIRTGAVVNARNDQDESPLHVAHTWTTAHILLQNRAKIETHDCHGRVPLMSWAASEWPCHAIMLENWVQILEAGMDLWVVDSQDRTLLELLLAKGKVKQACGLVSAVREVCPKDINKRVKPSGDTLLHIACKFMADDAQALVNLLLEGGANPNIQNLCKETPLHITCRKVVQTFQSQSRGEAGKSVYMWVVGRLLQYQAEPKMLNEEEISCIDISRDFPDLQQSLETPVAQFSETAPLIKWESQSAKHKHKLDQVSKGQTSVTVDCYSYHMNPIGSGAFGHVYAGIDETDGREVAIKRIERQRISLTQREIDNLVKLKDCEQVVKYLRRVEDEQKHFVYLILELMEGNLEEFMKASPKDPQIFTELCRDVMLGMDHLHRCAIKHRDIKPENILYKTTPRVCLKLADFGLSSKVTLGEADSTAGTKQTGAPSVMHSHAGTRCWMASELLQEESPGKHSNESDIFACGLVFHYILADTKHPFAPQGDPNLSKFLIENKTERNISKDVFIIDGSLSAEGQHLVQLMIKFDKEQRPDTTAVLKHPFFWSKQRKMQFLVAVANQPEIAAVRPKAPVALVRQDIEAALGPQFKACTWDNSFPHIYHQMVTKGKRAYCTTSAVDLLRFIRNCRTHVSHEHNTNLLRKAVLEGFVFLREFPTLFMDVYQIVFKHGWNYWDEIRYTLDIG